MKNHLETLRAASMFSGSQPNESGVYAPDERITLHREVKGWLGMPTAEIKLAKLGDYWIWATDFSIMTGDNWGSGSPLMDDGHRPFMSHRAPTRQAAIDAARAYLRAKLAGRPSTDARRIIDWIDGLRPAQRDLFGEAA